MNSFQSIKEVILAGFTYDDKDAAESLIVKLSESGVKVVIYADGIPQNKKDTESGILRSDLQRYCI